MTVGWRNRNPYIDQPHSWT